MNVKNIKSNLRKFYDEEAKYRNLNHKQEWKLNQREIFYNYIKKEGKDTLLELGAGTGQDSKFFMDCGLKVTAIDLSNEMVKICKEKGIDAYELDFYNLSDLNKKYHCIWSMNSLLHVPKDDLPRVLKSIDFVLNEDGLFYMGVYGGEDTESNWINDVSEIPRFFSYYSKDKLKEVLQDVFEIVSFDQFDVCKNIDFQSIIMRKK